MNTLEVSQEIINFINLALLKHRGRPLTEGEKFVLECVWSNLTYVEMVELSRKRGREYKMSYLQQSAGPKLFKVLSETFKEDISKGNVQIVIEQLLKARHQDSLKITTREVIGDLPDMGSLWGRDLELKEIEGIISDGNRIVAITGMGGVGKTHLTIQLIKNLEGRFKFFLWKSLQDALPLDELLEYLIKNLPSEKNEQTDSENKPNNLALLIKCLKDNSCLIVLDNVETIFQDGEIAGVYKQKKGYEDYAKLFEKIGQSAHQSCLLLTSRDTPTEIQSMTFFKSYQLKGLLSEGLMEYLTKIKLIKNEEVLDAQIKELIDRYESSPLALQQITALVNGGYFTVQELLQASPFGKIRELLDKQFDRLSFHEKVVMFWLSIMHAPVTSSYLKENILIDIGSPSLSEILNSLYGRALMNKTKDSLYISGIIKEYIFEKFENQVCNEIKIEKPYYSIRVPVLTSNAEDYIYKTQVRLIKQSLLNKLRTEFSNLEESLKGIIKNLKKSEDSYYSRPNYLIGSLLNLLICMGADLSDLNLSNLYIREVSFKNTSLRGVNLFGCDLPNSSFADILGKVNSLKLSPDGEFVWIGNSNNIIEIWKVSDGILINTLYKHKDIVIFFAFSLNGEFAASFSKDGIIKLWQVDVEKGTAKYIKDLNENEQSQSLPYNLKSRNLSIGETKSELASSFIKGIEAVRNDELIIPNIDNSDYIRSAKSYAHNRLAISDSNVVKVLNMESEEPLDTFTLPDNKKTVSVLEFSTDGESILIASERTIYIYTIKDRSVKECEHKGIVRSALFIKNDTKIVSSSNETIYVWNVEDGDLNYRITEHESRISAMDVSFDKRVIITGTEDRELKIWDLSKYKCLRTIKSFNNQVKSISLSPDNKLLATSCEDCKIRIWDYDSPDKVPEEISTNNSWIWSIAFSPDSEHLAGGGGDNLVYLWNAKNGECLWSSKGHENKILSIAFNDGIIASGGDDKTIRLWDATTGNHLKTFDEHKSRVWSLSFSKIGKTLASGDYDGCIKIWDVEKKELIDSLNMYDLIAEFNESKGEKKKGRVLATAFFQNEFLAIAGDSEYVCIWDVTMRKTQKLLYAESTTNSIWSLAFSPDGRFIAAGCNDKKVRIWNFNKDEIVDELCMCWDVLVSQPLSLTFMDDSESLVTRAIVNDREIVVSINCITGELSREFRSPRPYEGLIISNTKGLNQSQRESLIALGATDR